MNFSLSICSIWIFNICRNDGVWKAFLLNYLQNSDLAWHKHSYLCLDTSIYFIMCLPIFQIYLALARSPSFSALCPLVFSGSSPSWSRRTCSAPIHCSINSLSKIKLLRTLCFCLLIFRLWTLYWCLVWPAILSLSHAQALSLQPAGHAQPPASVPVLFSLPPPICRWYSVLHRKILFSLKTNTRYSRLSKFALWTP